VGFTQIVEPTRFVRFSFALSSCLLAFFMQLAAADDFQRGPVSLCRLSPRGSSWHARARVGFDNKMNLQRNAEFQLTGTKGTLHREHGMAKKAKKRKYSKGASKKVSRAMKKRKAGTLKSGRSGRKVKSRKQAIAIGLSEARRSGAKVPKKRSGKKKSGKKRSKRKS
jgi:Family of unknown function (DUF6496)